MYNKRSIGSDWENRAKEYLELQGYHIIEQNFNSRIGEIDIVAKENEYLVFIEVKYRTSTSMGHPEESITYRKMKAIIKTARYYMLKNGISEDTPSRFDVVAILGDHISLIRNAFEVF